ncbi:hypothetical protein E2C01_090877 [Portunus trituberculatus]|uniref:Uncharacterized protein n=1 Tax=Portunus trituberculatus TaxID=210409 RepID=A0A5B7JRC8_PORTR|nr:hypothetical protein [Portunus trituberculatus]
MDPITSAITASTHSPPQCQKASRRWPGGQADSGYQLSRSEWMPQAATALISHSAYPPSSSFRPKAPHSFLSLHTVISLSRLHTVIFPLPHTTPPVDLRVVSPKRPRLQTVP